MEATFAGGEWWTYIAVFLAAATPVVEILVVIPAAVLAGLSPVPVALLAVSGNVLTLALAVMAADRIRASRRGDGSVSRHSLLRARAERARRLARRWGVPGLALLAPVTTGTHIAALGALGFDRDPRRVLAWMSAGLVIWSVPITIASVLGVDFFF